MTIKIIAKNLLKHTPFYPIHIGYYTRNLYFWKYVKKLPVKNFTYVLDAGCGEGEYAKKLAIEYPHLKIDAYDIKRKRLWNKHPKNVNFKQMDLLKLEAENCYDFCLSIDVLEHIPGNKRVLKNIYKALKSNAYFYLHTPSRVQERIFPEKFFSKFEGWVKEEHVGEMYKFEGLMGMITSIGFEVIEARRTFGFWGKFAWEVDRITDKLLFLKVVLMPLLKFLSQLDVKFSREGNGMLILSRKNP